MIIERGKLYIEPEFYEKIRASVMALHERLIKADLATPEVREYLNGCRVILSGRMVRSAGIARIRKHCIALNVRLLAIYPDELPGVVVHEVCHLLAARLYGDWYHDEPWQQLMIKLGCEPRRYHTLDPSRIWLRQFVEPGNRGSGGCAQMAFGGDERVELPPSI